MHDLLTFNHSAAFRTLPLQYSTALIITSFSISEKGRMVLPDVRAMLGSFGGLS